MQKAISKGQKMPASGTYDNVPRRAPVRRFQGVGLVGFSGRGFGRSAAVVSFLCLCGFGMGRGRCVEDSWALAVDPVADPMYRCVDACCCQ